MPDALQLGPLLLPAPLLVVLTAVAVTLLLGRWLDRSPGKPAETTVLTGVLVGALFARLAFVYEYRTLYFSAPLGMLDIRDGGWNAAAGLAAFLIHGIVQQRRRPELARPLRWALGTGTAVFVAGLAALTLRPGPPDPMPELTLHTLDGRPVALRSFVGQPVVLNLWATWCPPCVREMPVLQRLQRERGDLHVVFANQGEDAAQVAAWLRLRQLSLANVLIDPRRQASAAFKQQGYPTTLFFDARGRHVGTRVGELSDATLAQWVARVER